MILREMAVLPNQYLKLIAGTDLYQDLVESMY